MRIKFIICLLLLLVIFPTSNVFASQDATQNSEEELNLKELILGHLDNSYEWHIVSWKEHHISIPLPIILYSKSNGWDLFLSNKFDNEKNSYGSYSIAHSGKFKGKIVEKVISGDEVRPLDLSLTKNAVSLLISSLILVLIILSTAHSLKRNPMESKKGFTGVMEMFIMSVNDDIIKPSVGKDNQKYAPYLLTVFFFILFNNLLGLIPLFPGGANVTGNISITVVLAVGTFILVNVSGTREYFKEIFWPDVPTWLKVPLPLMPAIEIVGIFTKPFALMIRLFANIIAGHAIVLGLVTVIFVTVSMGTAINASMTVVSVVFTVFINFVELLVAYIQAYVFTLLSAVFIGMARVDHVKEKEQIKN